jgi:hypothetical protein
MESRSDGVMEYRSNGVLSITVALEPSLSPSLHRSNTPTLQHSNTPTLHGRSALHRDPRVLDMGSNNLIEIRLGFEPEPTRARRI